ncbi:MAG: DUF805 domain-containing protein [Limimaricola sp.]|uniref:DUF805 domain-containing protein n=1 Tax=Limimaricola sp. TaxID=2211665 RepID=UPI001D2F7ECE|nr:DUF805 domain-containing protein [Limimaricola sp.]MBI1417401.1 DUF805 domain-containing protein [Limimaricola sp.]
MTFTESIQTCFGKYATFSGRAARSEYWWFVLFVMVVTFLLEIIDIRLFGVTVVGPGSISGSTGFAPFSTLFMLVTLLPGLGVAARRLHDNDRSAWWLLIALVPVVGFIVLLVWLVGRGTPGPNRFGPDPVASTATL